MDKGWYAYTRGAGSEADMSVQEGIVEISRVVYPYTRGNRRDVLMYL